MSVTLEAPTLAELQALLDRDIDQKCHFAFTHGCRLAVAVRSMVTTEPCAVTFDFTVLSPGEFPQKGWTLYEDRMGVAVGRSA